MNAQEALEIITNAIQSDGMTAEQDKALAIAQKALEKQIPKKPKIDNDEGSLTMTDNEIIKMLEDNALKCTHYGDIGNGGSFESALDIINRQKSEIERLQHYCFGIQNELEAYKDTFNTAIDETKFEAIKEFAEQLKQNINESIGLYWDEIAGSYYVSEDVINDIDSLVKEMTEEK